VGLIGSGKMGRHHLKAIAASGRATVVGVADPAGSSERLKLVQRMVLGSKEPVDVAAAFASERC
jgi:predicted dehydrogenase